MLRQRGERRDMKDIASTKRAGLTAPTLALSAIALVAGAGTAGALGLDRSGQDVTAIFEEGNYAELNFGMAVPELGGTDRPNPFNPAGYSYDDVANDFSQVGASLKYDVSDRVSVAVIIDQPFGADIEYPGPANTWLGGTEAYLESRALTALARYQVNDLFSVHGGLRGQRQSGEITLSGIGYGGLSGYNVTLADSTAYGYVLGVAYERPDIALRVALTYNSAIEHEFDTVETLNGVTVNPGSTTDVKSPEAINLDFQTGIAADTLLFGQVRYAAYEDTIVSPDFFASQTGGGSLTEIDSGTAYTLGVGRRFTEAFSASFAVGYEAESDDSLVSPLAPSNGATWATLGGQYTIDNVVLSGGIRYTVLGDAQAETGTPDAARADFTDNSAVAIGASIGYRF